jgi:hypothetical protein
MIFLKKNGYKVVVSWFDLFWDKHPETRCEKEFKDMPAFFLWAEDSISD